MVHKLIISQRGKAWKLEIESEVLNGRSIGDKASGKEIKPELEGYEFEITGGSDDAGFPLSAEVAGIGLVSELKTKGFAMKDSTAGIRRRKTVRGKIISDNTAQINLNVIKAGAKKLEEIKSLHCKTKSTCLPAISIDLNKLKISFVFPET